MSAPAIRRRALSPGRLHLPSVHVQDQDGRGFDYEEDLFVFGRGRLTTVKRVVRLVAKVHGEIVLNRVTRDVLCPQEVAELIEVLPMLMEEGNPEAEAAMQEVARSEYARQLRIASGLETACQACGCSESKACSGGCIWATRTICSRCSKGGGR